jgi:hypothetical protein
MKLVRLVALAACVLVGVGVANAGTATISQTLDYTDDIGTGWAFWVPDTIIDHTPFHRHAWEDWGWTHNVIALVPHDATGIETATLSIVAWGAADDANEVQVHVVYVNGVRVGALEGPSNGQPVPPVPPEAYQTPGQPNTLSAEWSLTSFTLPANVLQELWGDGKPEVFLNIDVPVEGHRVTIRSSTLTVKYTVPGDGGDVGAQPDVAVHRFWSPVQSTHFYTISEQEKDMLIRDFPHVWTYEGIGYHTFSTAADAGLKPVYRFWAGSLGVHFYTISEQERDIVIRDYGYVWAYEGIAFYAYPEGQQPAGALPVYRFWSPRLSRHFYTISEQEKQTLVDQHSYTWSLEGVAWYAYE